MSCAPALEVAVGALGRVVAALHGHRHEYLDPPLALAEAVERRLRLGLGLACLLAPCLAPVVLGALVRCQDRL